MLARTVVRYQTHIKNYPITKRSIPRGFCALYILRCLLKNSQAAALNFVKGAGPVSSVIKGKLKIFGWTFIMFPGKTSDCLQEKVTFINQFWRVYICISYRLISCGWTTKNIQLDKSEFYILQAFVSVLRVSEVYYLDRLLLLVCGSCVII